MAEPARQTDNNQTAFSPNPAGNFINAKQQFEKRRELTRVQRADRQLEADKAQQLNQGAPMQGVGASGGLGGGSAWPQPAQKLDPRQQQPMREKAAKTGETAATAGQAAGSAMKAGGQGMELGGKALKAGGGFAGKGLGGALGGVAGGVTGALGGPQGIVAGAKAGASAGSRIGGQVGRMPGQTMEKAGQGMEKAGDKTKSMSRRFKEKMHRAREEKKSKNQTAEKINEAVGAKAATSWLLRFAWSSQLTIIGFVTAFWAIFWYGYILIHFLAAYFTPFSNYFCKFGEEWTKLSGVPVALQARATKRLDKKLELAEIAFFVFLSILYIIVLFVIMGTIGIIIYAWTHKLETIKIIGLSALKLVWSTTLKIIGF